MHDVEAFIYIFIEFPLIFNLFLFFCRLAFGVWRMAVAVGVREGRKIEEKNEEYKVLKKNPKK